LICSLSLAKIGISHKRSATEWVSNLISNPELTEEEMRGALFGDDEQTAQGSEPPLQKPLPGIVILQPAMAAERKKVAKAFTPRLRWWEMSLKDFE
jgi:hypothetical protein